MKHTEGSMINLLHERYGTLSQGSGRRYVAMSHVRSDAGFDAKRTADFMALDLWPSKGLMLHGHEVKISRSDWLNELKDPEKSGEFLKHVDYWWLVIADKDMVRPGELPASWGMMTVGGDGKLRVVRQAPRLTEQESVPTSWGGRKLVSQPVHRGLVASMLRSAATTSMVRERLALTAVHDEWKATHSLAADEWEVSFRDTDGLEVTQRFPDEASAEAWRDRHVVAGWERWRFHMDRVKTFTYESRDWL